MNERRCEICRCWERDSDTDFGLCKAHGPQATVATIYEGMEFRIVWPKTGKDDSCFHDFVVVVQ